MPTYYMSFADDDGWRGAVIVAADTFSLAVAKTHQLGINPGGEIAAVDCSPAPAAEWYDRLLDRAQLRELGRSMGDTRAHNGQGEEFEL